MRKNIDIRESQLKEAFQSPQKFVDFIVLLRAKAGIPTTEQEKQELFESILSKKGEHQ